MKVSDVVTSTVAVVALLISTYTAYRQFVIVEEVQQVVTENSFFDPKPYKFPPKEVYPDRRPNEKVNILIANYGNRAIILESAIVYSPSWPPSAPDPGNAVCNYTEIGGDKSPTFAYGGNIFADDKPVVSAIVKKEDAQVFEIEYRIQNLLASDQDAHRTVPKWTDGGEPQNAFYVCLQTNYRDSLLRQIIVKQLFYKVDIYSRSQDGRANEFSYSMNTGESPYKTVASRWSFW